MLNFREYLIEAAKEDRTAGKLTHLRHTEDNVIYGGDQGVAKADSHLSAVHNMLLGRKSGVHVSTKWDGAPAVVFGPDPASGRFFVATKSAFNANPKLNYTPEDIERNHGHAPGLVEKLKAALEHLPSIMPREGGVYQGDIIHTKGDAKTENGMTSVTPNTLTMSAPADSPEGQNMQKPFGIVIHTKYKGRGGLGNMSAGPLDDRTRGKFSENPNVNNIDPSMNVNPANYTPAEQQQYLAHMEAARKTYAKMAPEAMEALEGHGQTLESHVNDQIRKGGAPSVQGYMNYLNDRHAKDVGKLKSQPTIDRRNQAHADMIQHLTENQDHFQKALELHQHMQNAKNVLVGVMEKNNPYAHSVGGVPTGPEGAVVVDHDGEMSKMNNRQEFNRLNFLKGAFQKNAAQAAENPE